MAQVVEEFEIDGVKFWFRRISLEDGCTGLRMVSEVMTPAFNAKDFASALTKSIDQLPKLVDLFVPYCQVEGDGIAAGRKVQLKAFKQDAFAGHLDRALLFVANCAVIEYGDFLGERLAKLGTGLGELVQRFPSLQALIPSSGDSSSADTSKTD